MADNKVPKPVLKPGLGWGSFLVRVHGQLLNWTERLSERKCSLCVALTESFWTVVAQRLEHMPDMHAVGGLIPPHSIFLEGG